MREKHTLAFPIFLQAILLWFLPFSFLAVTLFLGGANKDKIKKAIFPDSQSFVNLKSNTMKNTVQIYGFLSNLQIKQEKRDVL